MNNPVNFLQETGALPVLPLRDAVIFPQIVLPLFVGRRASLDAIEAAFSSITRQIFLVTQKNSQTDEPAPADMYSLGVVSRIIQKLPMPDGSVKILCEGLYRATVKDLVFNNAFYTARPEKAVEFESRTSERDALSIAVKTALSNFEKPGYSISQESLLSITALKTPGELADAIMPHLKLDYRKNQEVLEILDVSERLEKVYELLESEKAFSDIERRIQNRVKFQMEANQKEYYLTEQLKAINREMGREDDGQTELLRLENLLREKNLPEEVFEKGLEEIRKLRSMTPMVAEYAVSRAYVDWILQLPWNNPRANDISITHARKILDSEHFGLEKAKQRILEFLAVQKLSKSLKGPILCFVGPPGVGKTSLASSVARAMGRDFARLSLGGVRDEAEIRGHRRTYVGALPGKIIQSLKKVKSSNPVFCLDEIDKMASDYRGDPAAALLEALDPEQNSSFMDHYLDIDYDLSGIFFITTANSLQTIPAPLLDRMEVIEIPSYLETEKRHIAKNFLIPRQLKMHGLTPGNLSISEPALQNIIQYYTRESGVRNLDRAIASLCRKSAIRLVESGNSEKRISIGKQNLRSFLGPAKFHHEVREQKPQVGVCAGLAFNQSGGDILFVETSLMSGTGQIVTTGQLGEIMTESAKAALSYVRSRAELLGLDPEFYKRVDIHVHVPSGATPKDGPSAGITLATSITSALLGIPVRNDIAMTGEISLRGRVLPIGGLREKLLAARRSGIQKVIVPEDNRADIDEIPEEVMKGLDVYFVRHVDEVLPKALKASGEKIFINTDASDSLVSSLRSASRGS